MKPTRRRLAALVAGLVLKEVPFLLWSVVALLQRVGEGARIARQLDVTASLGYARRTAWWRVLWPQLLPRLNIPLVATRNAAPDARNVEDRALVLLAAVALAAAALATPALAWEPSKPVEFVVPAGTGGGADQMARLMQGIIVKHKLMNQSLIVVNKSGGAGAEGFLSVKEAKGDPHKIIITLSNLFTTPLATGVPFNWKDMTPVAMMALDQFVLWVNAEAPYKTAKDYISAVKAAGPSKMKMGGTGSKQEDQIITVLLEKAAGKKMTYIPYKGGGDVAVQLVGNHVNSTVNNPIEAESHWRAGKLRALCVMDSKQLVYT